MFSSTTSGRFKDHARTTPLNSATGALLLEPVLQAVAKSVKTEKMKHLALSRQNCH